MKRGATSPDIGPVLRFLRCRTPAAWVDRAVADPGTLLNDHAALELKAAQQAQTLIRRYGASPGRSRPAPAGPWRRRLLQRMSRLAREELRHFEQVVRLLERRGGSWRALSPSRYAGALHALAGRGEPEALIDTLIIGAIIEARSCERFLSLLEPLAAVDAELAKFYAALLGAEARHFEHYLELARLVAADDPDCLQARVERLLARDAELVVLPDAELRFLGGPPPR